MSGTLSPCLCPVSSQETVNPVSLPHIIQFASQWDADQTLIDPDRHVLTPGPERRMKQIERYIFKRMATLTFWSLVSATALVLTTQVLIRVDVLTTTGQALGAFLLLAATLIPSVFVVVAPFAVLIGVGQVLSGMNGDSELAVIEAAGVKPVSVLKPVLVLSAGISLFVFLVAHAVEPWANRKLSSVIAEAQSDLFSLAVRSGSFMQLEKGLYIQINEKLPGGEFGGLFLADTRTEGNETIYTARRASIAEASGTDILIMQDGEVQSRTLSNGQISIIKFASYALDMNAFVPAGPQAQLRPKEQPTSYLLSPSPDDYFVSKAPFVITEELVNRFTTWLFPLLFGLITFSFLGKARSHRSEQVQTVMLATIIALSIRGFGFYSADSAGRSGFLEFMSYAVPGGCIVLFGLLAATGRSLSMPKAWARLNQRLYDRLSAAYEGWQRRGRREEPA